MNQKKNWEPFVEAMSNATGLKINAFYATDYAGVIEAMRFNKVQIAWFGNKSGMEAVDRANGQVLAQVVSRDGNTRLLLPYHRHTKTVRITRSTISSNATSRWTSGLVIQTRPPAFWCRPPISSLPRHRPEVLFQDRAQRQPRSQRDGGRQQASCCGDQQ